MGVSPIDFVVPMVFHQDPEWQRSFERIGSWFDRGDPKHFVRYRSWGNEELQIRAIKRCMPWVRTIYIILAQESQKQEWMDKEGVRVVYHRDFIPEKYLPLFNSQSIEMFLKDIPGLSERFIYANDDMFPLEPLSENDFFRDGLPCLNFKEVDFPSEPNIYHLGCRNGLNFVGGEFGIKYTDRWVKSCHGLTPMLRKTWEHLWERGEEEIRRSVSAFREPKNFNQYICPLWHFFTSRYYPHTPRTAYVSTLNPLGEVLEAILSEETQVVCINDNEAVTDYVEFANTVNEALEKRLV